MLGYDVQLKGFNQLDELSARLIVPLRDAAVVLANAIKTRVRNGVSPTGGQWTPLGEYSTTGRSKDDNNRWWVAPGQPQPGGYERKVQQGQWQGWVVYENYGRYLELLPNGKRRDWDKTGRLWASLGVPDGARRRHSGDGRLGCVVYAGGTRSACGRGRQCWAMTSSLRASTGSTSCRLG